MPEPRAKRISQASWAQHKDCITNLYIYRNATLDDVHQYLEEQGLGATQHQLRQQLKKWGLKKNMETIDWRRIAHLVTRRSLQGRDTGILRGRRYYGPVKIQKEIGRHCTASDMLRFRREPTPRCPDNITINTPRPKVIGITWPCTLPWLQFVHQSAERQQFSFYQAEGDSRLRKAIDQVPLPLDLLHLGVFGSTQPTLFTPQNLNCSYLLDRNHQRDAAEQAISILAFVLSNNRQHLFFHSPQVDKCQQFEILCGIFISSGLTNLEILAGSSRDYTKAAVLENLLDLAVPSPQVSRGRTSPFLGLGENGTVLISWALRSPPKRLVEQLLNSTYNATVLPFVYTHTHRQFARGRSNDWVKVIENILAGRPASADPIHLFQLFPKDQEVMLLTAALNQSPPMLGLVQTLLEHKPSLSEMLCKAEKADTGSCLFLELSPLICAASVRQEGIAFSTMKLILASRRPQGYMTQEESFDVMLALCLRGHDSLLDDWMHSHADFDVDACNAAGHSMLHAAVLGGHASTCEKVLRLGANVHTPRSPLLSPLYWCLGMSASVGTDLSRLLVQGGARIDSKVSCPFDHCPLHHSCLGVRNESFIYCRVKYAIEESNLEMFTLLLAICTSLHPAAQTGQSPANPLLTHQPRPSAPFPHDAKSAHFILHALTAGSSQCSAVLRSVGLCSVELAQLLRWRFGVADLDVITHNIIRPPGYDSNLLLEETHKACQNTSQRLRLLLSQRPVVLTGDENEVTAIAFAAVRDRPDILQALLKSLPPMICDRDWIHLDSTQELKRFRYFSVQSAKITTPLHAAVASRNDRSMEILRQFGFRIDRAVVSVAVATGRYEIVQRLLKERATWGTDRLSQWSTHTPLYMAVESEDSPMVQLLMKCGEDINSLEYRRIEFGRSPLQSAVEMDGMFMVEMLLDAGADVNQEAADNGGATALQLASIKGYMDLAKILLDRNADVNAPGARLRYGRTALQGAAENGRLDMVALLLSSGAHTQGPHRKSFIVAVALARREGHWVVERMLRERCSWFPEDENALELLTGRRDWQHLEAGESGSEWYSDSDSDWESGSNSDDDDKHLDTATSLEEGWKHDPPSSIMDLSNFRHSDHLVVDLTEDEALGCLEAEADTTLTACTGDANPDVLDSVASIGSAEADTCREENLSVVGDANGINAEMTDACQHSSPDEDTWPESVLPNFFDDATWAEDAAPYMNDGFWYGGPL